MRHLDLFSGIGGFALAAYWVWGAEYEIHSFVEIDPFCQKVLKKHWPDVPIQSDIKEYQHDGTKIDLLTGGYPCQAFSTATHGHNTAEDLSPVMLRVIAEVQPQLCVAENVQEQTIRNFALRLESFGYGTAVRSFDAVSIGADHIRKRWFCAAYADDKGELQSTIDAKMEGVPSVDPSTWGYENYARALRVHDGLSSRTYRFKAIGNAIVPQVVVPIFQAINFTE